MIVLSLLRTKSRVMKLFKTLLVSVVIILFSSCSKESIEEETLNLSSTEIVLSDADIMLAEELLLEINNYRLSIGKNTLQIDINDAQLLALQHCNYMVVQNTASHDNFMQRSLHLKSQGAIHVSENVSYGYTNAASILNAWLNSQGHKAVIEGDFNYIGIAFLNSATNTKYCTSLFYKK
jgi:uncharacterized protein YkwD